MRRLRFTAKALIPVLILTAMFFSSCNDDNGSDVNPTPTPDPDVASFEYTISSTVIDDYFGKIDTLNITMKALDADGLAVEDATPILDIIDGPGEILFLDGEKTSLEGTVTAKYVLTVAETDTAIISGKFGSLTARNKTVYISSEEVHVSITATPLETEVDQGATGTSNLKIRVRDSQGVNVSGVPIKVQLLSDEGVLTTPIEDETTDSFTSTITVDEVNTTTTCQIRAYIDVDVEIPTGEAVTDGTNNGKKSRTIDASTMTDTVSVRFVPVSNQVTNISISILPDQIIAGAGIDTSASVTIVAADDGNNGVPNLVLHYNLRHATNPDVNPKMSISPPVATDESGSTTATISTNGAVGTWVLEVRTYQGNENFWADTLKVVNGTPQNVVIASDTSRISIYGTNGIETTTVRAQVRDQNNQPVQDGKMVYFLAESYPRTNDVDDLRLRINDSDGDGSPFPDNVYINLPGLPFDSAATNGGEAFVTLTAGEKKGPVRLRVWTYEADGITEISSRFDGLMIVSGPPHNIEVDYNPTGVQQGSSIYNLEISARVQDEQNNDVEDGYSVSFWVEPEVAHVWDVGITGNPGPISSTMTPGVAYAALSYHSLMTNQEVVISSAITRANDERVVSTVTMVLPIQGAQGTMYASPMNWDYDENDDDDALINLRLEVRDSYGHYINDQLVLFGCSKGRIFSVPFAGVLDPEYYALTGPADVSGTPDDDPEGISFRYYVATLDEIFPDETTPETTVTIMAEIVGAQDASIEPITIFLIQ